MQAIQKRGAVAADTPLGSVALARVVAELSSGDMRLSQGGYNRTYNRHNR